MHRSSLLTAVVTVVTLATVVGMSIWPSIATGELFRPDPARGRRADVSLYRRQPLRREFLLEWEPEEWKVEKTFEMAHDAGLHWVKEQFPWESLQLSPGPNGYWNPQLNESTWDKYDQIVDLANKYDLELIVRLDRPPAWTRTDNTPSRGAARQLRPVRRFRLPGRQALSGSGSLLPDLERAKHLSRVGRAVTGSGRLHATSQDSLHPRQASRPQRRYLERATCPDHRGLEPKRR